MATGLVIHISSGENKHTEVLTDEQVRIGATDDCNLRLRVSDLPHSESADGPVLELARIKGAYRVVDFDESIEIIHNERPVERRKEIQDGDEVIIQPTNLRLTFFPIRSLPAVVPNTQLEMHVAPFIEQAALESAATARRDDAKVFLREFTRELVREINVSTKLLTFAIAVVLVGGVLYIGFGLVREIRTSHRVIDDQRAQLADMQRQLKQTSKEMTEIDKKNDSIQQTLSPAVKLFGDYGRGVCLISGSFYFVEPGTGRVLRYAEAQTNESGVSVQTGTEQAALTPDGKGAIAEFEFVGSGFYVGQGFVLTNRHMAQPWLADERAQSMSGAVHGQPHLKKLNAYFPDNQQPIPLKVKQIAAHDDLAACVLDLKDIPQTIPVLPLETDVDSVAVGKVVVLMGYPNGPDRLLAMLEESEARAIQVRHGSLDSLLGVLAQTKRLRPATTQGNVTDTVTRRIAYDARTAEGGSGAPLFGPSGRVIGVNFAIFTENQASNFAIPIRYAITLLEHSGWQPLKEGDKQTDTAAAAAPR